MSNSSSKPSSKFKSVSNIGNWTIPGEIVTYSFVAPEKKKKRKVIEEKPTYQFHLGGLEPRKNHIEVHQDYFCLDEAAEEKKRKV